jgi:hypothetical protein
MMVVLPRGLCFPGEKNNSALSGWRLTVPAFLVILYINPGIHTILNMQCLFAFQTSWFHFFVSLLSPLPCLSVLQP